MHVWFWSWRVGKAAICKGHVAGGAKTIIALMSMVLALITIIIIVVTTISFYEPSPSIFGSYFDIQ